VTWWANSPTVYRFMTWLMRLMVRTVIGPALEVTGLENVPTSGGLLVVSNHVATIDPPLTGAYMPRHDVYFMAKSESFRGFWARWILTGYHAFPVIRGTADRASLRRALGLLAGGHVVVMYPEGSRSWDGRLRRPHPGAGFLGRVADVRVLPVAVWGTENVLAKGSHWPRRSPVHLRYGPVFRLPRRDLDGTRPSSQRCADLMMEHVATLLPQRYRGIFDGVTDYEAVPPPAA
jgi:1-acyl-sn-glycerol-3-phosphate acyltransferase